MKRPQARVLLVEDDLDTREMYEFGLQLFGYDVRGLASAEAVVPLVRLQPPDVIVSDVSLPLVSGLQLCEELRREPAAAHLPIIAVTGAGTDLEVSRAYKAGFDLVLVKPVLPDQLAEAIQVFLERSGRLRPAVAAPSPRLLRLNGLITLNAVLLENRIAAVRRLPLAGASACIDAATPPRWDRRVEGPDGELDDGFFRCQVCRGSWRYHARRREFRRTP